MHRSTDRKRRLTAVVFALALGMLSLAAAAFASELEATAEVSGTAVTEVTVEQGDSTAFTINVGVSGKSACGATSSAKVNTAYSIDASGTPSAATPSTAMSFASPGSGGNCDAVKTGSASSYVHAASITADSATPVDDYSVPITFTEITNSNTTGGKLNDGTVQAITVNVVASSNGDPPPPANQAPTVLDPADDAHGTEGETLTASGSFADPDGDDLDLSADNTEGAFTDNGDGTWDWQLATTDDVTGGTITVTANDGNGGTATDSFDYSAANADPQINQLTLGGSNCDPQLTVDFSDAGIDDTHDASINWGDTSGPSPVDPATTGFQESHHYSVAGAYTITVTVNDDDAGTDSESIVANVYDVATVQQPINASGTSVFKNGSTVPVKIVATDCEGIIVPGLAPTLSLKYTGSGTGPVNETIVSSGSANSGNQMRETDTPGNYIYNLSLKGKDPGTYQVTFGGGVVGSVTFGVR